MMSLFAKFRIHRLHQALPNSISSVVDHLEPSDTVVDVGAHVGLSSLMFARPGCRVIAIEPNLHAFNKLRKSVTGFPNVETIRAAAVPDSSRQEVLLYLHQNYAQDPVLYAQGSSLLSGKPNLGRNTQIVPALDLSQLLNRLGAVAILKVDIEGYEVELLPALALNGSLDRVENIFVETHDAKWHDLRDQTAKMKMLCEARLGAHRLHWNWP